MNAVRLNEHKPPPRGTEVYVCDPSTTGQFVGISDAGIVWVCWSRKPGAFKSMCCAFGRLTTKVQLTPRQSECLAELLELTGESNPAYVADIELRATFVRGPRYKLAEIAEYVEGDGDYDTALGASYAVWDSLGSRGTEAHEIFAIRQHMLSHRLLAAKLEGRRKPNRRGLLAEIDSEIRRMRR